MKRRSRQDDSTVEISTSARFESDFSAMSLVEYLSQDQRPTFIVDLNRPPDSSDRSVTSLAFCNDALSSSVSLLEQIESAFSSRSVGSSFASWAFSHDADERGPGSKESKAFHDVLWTINRISGDWAVVSGVELSTSDFSSFKAVQALTPQGDIQMRDAGSSHSSMSQSDEDSRLGETSDRPHHALGEIYPPSNLPVSDHIRFIREFDWASIPSIGPIESWSPHLRHTCDIVLASPDPATLFWGDDLILLYNEAYVALSGDKHPKMMGQSARVHWAEVWDQFNALFEQIKLDGRAFKQENSQLFLKCGPYEEERFFNLIVMPVVDDNGKVVGFYEPIHEVTRQSLSERRMQTLLQVSEKLSSATSLKELWRLVLSALNGHENDIHFAILYTSSETRSSEYSFEGVVGFQPRTTVFPPTISILNEGQEGFIPAFQTAHRSGKAVLLQTEDGSLNPELLERLRDCGVKESPRAMVIYPLSSSVDEDKEAFVAFGISPKRQYDDDYVLFHQLLARQIESTITFVKLFEKEKLRLREQAAYESELRFTRFAENAPIGILNFDSVGDIRFRNQAWLDISGHDPNDMSAMSWVDDIHPECVDETKKYWDKLINGEGQQTFEVQYKKPWRLHKNGKENIALDRTWVVASIDGEFDEKGVLTGILGCVTDISNQKWVDQIQSQRLMEALELKRQQENFLDITSHEMRNPLNAILHSATELIELLSEQSTKIGPEDRSSVIAECLEASRTIVYCGRHQKRIIDDVLTLSKLDSDLLTIAPLDTRPLEVVEEVLKVFDSELRASKIQARTELTELYKAQSIDTLLIDPHRVIQILINLVANAIKFTKGESLRSLHIVIDALLDEPESDSNGTGVRYVPSGRQQKDPTEQAEWGKGDVLFLHFSVQDTGPGMSQQEADLLFNRFAQGSPRTHVQYGGSGLGLFISRELAELHGGCIGISSQLGYGSTFDFYVKARRSTITTQLKSNSPPNPPPGTAQPRTPGITRRISSESLIPVMREINASPAVIQSKPVSGNGSDTATTPTLHILIVEDNLVNQKILSKLMRKQGYLVSIANHGEEALTIIQASRWLRRNINEATATKLDVVLADIEMPVMDGKECVRRIRQGQREEVLEQGIPVIAVTGNARPEQIIQAMECGFDDVVSKPYQVADLVKRIQFFTTGGDGRS